MTDNGTALSVSGVTVSYGGIVAVDDVSFDVPQGQILGLIGPNGAGKTTLFDAVCGFAPLAGGRIVLDGTEITSLNPAERSRAGLGRSFQDARLFGSLTVAEGLACALERTVRAQGPISTLLGLPWVWSAEREVSLRVEELIDLLGLVAFRDKFISELSTGSRRIVDLACVLAHDPSVLLLDEPSSGIAQKETEALGPMLRRVKESTGCTMLLIEHDMPLVTSVSDELMALETGRVIARGTPREVTNDPRVVEAYLGTDERVVARSGAVASDGPTPKPTGKTRKKPAPRKTNATGKTKTSGKAKTSRKTKATRKSTRKKAATRKKPAARKPAASRKTSTRGETSGTKPADRSRGGKGRSG